ncbi:MAG: hypothetical protein AMJ56_15645 [Anaerolineae bacterium SG8_19]|jgi:uncharacterized membrane protein|nr:MAG: hypothetical protein AMJ56_15645 [Anaerolineae bacterium SG8_19]
MSDKKEKSAVFNILAFNFDGEETAEETVKQIKKSGALDGQLIVAEAIVSVNEKGKTHIHEPGHGTMGAVLGGAGVGLLSLIGGPAGLLAWTVGGAVVGGVAGKYLGRPFSKGDLKEIGEAMAPDTSAFLLLVEDIASETVVDSMKEYNANVVTLTVGDDLSGQIASYVAGEATDDQGNVVAGAGGVAADDEGDVAAAGGIVAATDE